MLSWGWGIPAFLRLLRAFWGLPYKTLVLRGVVVKTPGCPVMSWDGGMVLLGNALPCRSLDLMMEQPSSQPPSEPGQIQVS